MISSAREFVELMELHWADHRERRWREDVASEAVWFEVIQTRPDLRSAVAMNRHLPDAVLVRLAKDEDERVRCLVAEKRRLPSELFMLLARDPDDAVRSTIAHNKKVPVAVLEELVHDRWKEIANTARQRLGRS
jgi:hypothetical protein